MGEREEQVIGADQVADDVVGDIDNSRLQALAFAGMAWSLFRQWGVRFISIIVFTVLARTLTPDHFGLVALASVFVGFLDIPLRVSLGDALVQRAELRVQQLDSAFWGLLGVSLILTFCMVAASPLLADAVGNRSVALVVAVLALGLPLTAMSVVPEAILRRQMEFKRLAVRKVSGDSSAGAAGVGLALAGAGVWSLVVKLLVSDVVEVVLAFRAVSWRPRFRFSWSELREIAVYGTWSTINSSVGFISRNADNLVIGAVLGAEALGYYSIAFQMLTIVVLLVTDTIESTAMSTFSRLQHDRARVGRGFALGVRACTLALVVASVVTVSLAPSIVARWFGEQWLPSSDIIRVLILGGLLAPITSLAMTVLKSMGRPDLAVRLALARSVIGVTGFVIGAQFGVIWVAFAQVVTLVMIIPLYLRAVHRLCEVAWRPLVRSVVTFLVAGVFSGALAVVVAGRSSEPVPELWRLAVAVAASLSVMAVMVAVFARGEVNEVLELVRRQRGRVAA
ncbi:MAG: lipopolysaccharide biosynthesis protein [Acidimicrobiales bacterium]